MHKLGARNGGERRARTTYPRAARLCRRCWRPNGLIDVYRLVRVFFGLPKPSELTANPTCRTWRLLSTVLSGLVLLPLHGEAELRVGSEQAFGTRSNVPDDRRPQQGLERRSSLCPSRSASTAAWTPASPPSYWRASRKRELCLSFSNAHPGTVIRNENLVQKKPERALVSWGVESDGVPVAAPAADAARLLGEQCRLLGERPIRKAVGQRRRGAVSDRLSWRL